ncbi:DUF5058 family protein [Brevibacterium daeguense]|uniref:DUF5058 family protein n=1 Tax=Brevibacterium daeguense TaxID=909936 RepID=A0ABP8EKN8_9MICO
MIWAQSTSTDIIGIANIPVLWVLALAVFAVIILQSVIYLIAVKRAARAADMTQREVNQSFRAGAVAAIGPSLAVVLVSVALLPLFGTPPVLVRIGLIGSAATEVASASLATNTLGVDLGGSGYTQAVFIVALMAMSLSGAMWQICTMILTPLLGKGTDVLQRVNPALMSIVPSAALLAAFASLTITEIPKSLAHIAAVVASALVMVACLLLARALSQAWLREWALGFSIIGGLIVAYFVHYAGYGAAA